MKTNIYLTFSFLLLLFCNLISAQNPENKMISDSVLQQEYPEVKAEIEGLVHQLYESIRKGEVEKQKSFHTYSDKFTAFYGGRLRKDAAGAQEYEENLVNHFTKVEDVNFDIRDMQVNVFDKVAVASFHIYVSSGVDQEKRQSQAQVSLVYLNLNGAWKITHEHVSPLTEVISEK